MFSVRVLFKVAFVGAVGQGVGEVEPLESTNVSAGAGKQEVAWVFA